MNKKILYTTEEVETIKRFLSECSTTKEACKEASKHINRNEKAIAMYIYHHKELFTRKNKHKPINTNDIKEVLESELKANPNNIREALRTTASKTGSCYSTLRNYYYNQPSKKLHRNNLNVCFTLVSGKKAVYNGKNTTNPKFKVSKNKSIKLIEFFKNLFK